MSRKALHLVVNLEIQAVTCPGVWLCPNGNVQLLFSMLGEEVQTKRLPPVFPLLFHEKLDFQKTFPSAGCLAEVQDALGRESVYAVLIQEVEGPNGSAAVQLARFHSSALHILYPSPCSKGLLAGVDVDLLMEASADFPGILSPKIELSTKTLVKEVASSAQDGYVINPKTLSSQRIPLQHCVEDVKTNDARGKFRICSSRQFERSRKVKHGQGLNISMALPRVSPSHIQHRSSHSHINAHPNGHAHCTEKCGLQETAPDCNEFCHCGTEHLSSKCSLCMQYKTVFSSFTDFTDSPQNQHKNHPSGICMRKRPISAKFEDTKRLSNSLHAHVDRILEPTMSNILHNRDINAYAPFAQSQSHHVFSQRKQKSDITEPVKKPCESDPCFQASCGSGDEYTSHRQLFYANLEKFYRKLYDRAKSRAQEEIYSGNGN